MSQAGTPPMLSIDSLFSYSSGTLIGALVDDQLTNDFCASYIYRNVLTGTAKCPLTTTFLSFLQFYKYFYVFFFYLSHFFITQDPHQGNLNKHRTVRYLLTCMYIYIYIYIQDQLVDQGGGGKIDGYKVQYTNLFHNSLKILRTPSIIILIRR